MRDKRGRFSKVDKLEIPIPSIGVVLKYAILLFLLLPWLYIITFRFEFFRMIGEIMEYLFEGTKEIKNGKSPY